MLLLLLLLVLLQSYKHQWQTLQKSVLVTHFPWTLKYSFTHSSIKPIKHLIQFSDLFGPDKDNLLSEQISRLPPLFYLQVECSLTCPAGVTVAFTEPRKSHAPYAAALPRCFTISERHNPEANLLYVDCKRDS